jgi:PQQ-like domain
LPLTAPGTALDYGKVLSKGRQELSVAVNGLLYVSSTDGNLYAFAAGGPGADALRSLSTAPVISSLHPDMRLVPVR